MSYDNSNSAPGSDSRGRLGRSEEVEDREAGPGADSLNNNGDTSASEGTNRERGSSPGSGSGGSSGGDPRGPNSDDTDGLSSGNDSRGRPSTRSSHSSSNGKDSAMLLETTDSSKSSNSQIPSPPSSSLAYSLLSGSSEQDPPSTSGCSSDQSARVRTQKELMKALRELKIRLPAERRGKGHSSTLEALKYALNCVKQVRANQEYYHQWSVEECHDCSLDLSTFTIEELDNITSEYTLKNTDTFSMAVSFLSGKVVYVSPQGASLLRCKPEKLQSTVFSELLAPQDVSTFYSSTAPCRLPAWASCIGSVSPAVDCTQEKSMFCRISADRAHGSEMRYYPFRLTPYQLTLRDSDCSEPQPCCLLIAERVHSGYEAPRIPTDKRIFTTSHTPSCLFQEVDERAVPLLGYLPQDLVGTPVLLYLHPEDRPIMVAIHKKILQFAGQPFDHAPLRMCARSGEYVTIDTSWSSFVNPWSRKVAFIVGRHKVRTSPLNEDVFTPPRGCDARALTPDVGQLSEQIHRLLVQPVHSGSSQGYSSLGSSASHGSHKRPHLSAASSSDSNDAAVATVAAHNPMTFQQICKDVHMVKTNGQQVFIESRNRAPLRKHAAAAATGAVGGLRAIGGADPIKELIADVAGLPKNPPPTEQIQKEPPSTYSYQQINCLDSIIRYLDSCSVPNPVKRKCGSSSCTASSTSDDNKQQEATSTAKDIVMEEAPPTPTSAPPAPPAPPAAVAPAALAPPSQAAQPEREGSRRGGRFGLTKEVLSAHTQQEEQAFLCRFRDLSQLRVFDPASSALRCPPTATSPLARGARCSRDYPAAGGSSTRRRRGPGGKRLKHQESSDQRIPLRVAGPPTSTYPLPLGPPTTSSSWPTSVASQASLPSVPYPPGMLPIYPIYPPLSQPMPVPVPDPSLAAGLRFPALQNPQMVPPMMALVLPNYMFPQLNPSIPQLAQPGAAVMPPAHQHFYNPNAAFPFAGPMAVPLPVPAGVPAQAPPRAPSRSSTPQSCGPAPAEREGADSPLFQSRCSSPLNLLQLEESPSSRLEVATALAAAQQAAPSAQGGGAASEGSSNQRSSEDHSKENENGETNESNHDAMSTSSDLLDLLLQEDSRSGTGSAGSGSGSLGTGSSGSGSLGTGSSGSGSLGTGSSGSGSGSNGCSSSGSGTRSSHTSKYFGSVDSSENDHSRKRPAGGASGDEQFIKSVLQDPIWLLMANTNDTVMMTYQMPVRDMEAVLREDREALRPMQKHQPRFTEEQKRELSQVHPWIRTGRLPRTINVSACMGCRSPPLAAPYDVETHEMELGGALEATEQAGAQEKATAAMDQGEGSQGQSQGNDQEMTTEEQEVTSPKAVATVMTH
ncbi:period circadian protein homolog 1b isoform X2 [Hypomesus transpacificus]|uniref:period circadian protein homolog 1b isoform X2 n=1 Tax=Hypomesus transpacificus TaxID=137520 RepID=UPI001F07EA07|nr:period circadian protein homolog 1b isoform X2 [Hypomesus transpacificus]